MEKEMSTGWFNPLKNSEVFLPANMHHERHAFNNVQSLKFDLATGWLQALYTIMSPISHLFNKQISSLAQNTEFSSPNQGCSN